MAFISRYDVEKLIRSNAPSKMRIDEEATEELVSIIEEKAGKIVERAVLVAMATHDKRRKAAKKVKLTKTDINIAATAV
ncbi:MAG: hypothetical protein N3H30_03120 [Candidatus Micrarchaeota archaeon]|nr:hypothetical protein [Candidatus Micrarchaeota archaeon]